MLQHLKRWTRVSLVCIALLVTLGCTITFRGCTTTTRRRMRITPVTEIGACHGWDEASMTPIDPTTTFPADTRRLVAFFYYADPEPEEAEFTSQWFLEGESVAVISGTLYPGYNFACMELEDPERNFPEGDYRVEFQVGRWLILDSAEFQVGTP